MIIASSLQERLAAASPDRVASGQELAAASRSHEQHWRDQACRCRTASHKVTPDLSERMSADIAHKWQIEDAPPAPATTGTLYEPMQSGRGVDGGVRERMAREERR